MRSEKVYLMTQMIHQKIDQLASEKTHIKQGYQAIDNRNDSIKKEITSKYQALKAEKEESDKLLEAKE